MRVAVIGSGVAGPVLSMLIKQRLGWDTTVFEAAHAIKEVGPCPEHSCPTQPSTSHAPPYIRTQRPCVPTASINSLRQTHHRCFAGISLAPNGLRVLASLDITPNLADQVVQEVGEPIPNTHVMRPDGSTIVQFDSMGQQVQ